jgi:hypothetical protein
MALPKHILVINSGIHPLVHSFVSDQGDIRLHFRDISHPRDLEKLQGMVFHDVVWIRRLPWDARYREELEYGVQMRVMRVENGT